MELDEKLREALGYPSAPTEPTKTESPIDPLPAYASANLAISRLTDYHHRSGLSLSDRLAGIRAVLAELDKVLRDQ